MITLLTDTEESHMAKSRGRDVSITRGTLPLNTTRYVAVNPLGISNPSPIVIASATRSYVGPRDAYDITPQSTPANRLAKTATGNNLHRPHPISKKFKVCKNRSIRKEVLFATGYGGRNNMKTARFTKNSKVRCK